MQGGPKKRREVRQVVEAGHGWGDGTGRQSLLDGDQPGAAWNCCGHFPELKQEACTEPRGKDGLSVATGQSRPFALGLQLLTHLPLHHALANMQSALPRPPELTDPAPPWGRRSRDCSGGFQGALPFLWFVQAERQGAVEATLHVSTSTNIRRGSVTLASHLTCLDRFSK